jgi:ribosomal protein L37AE/L43A
MNKDQFLQNTFLKDPSIVTEQYIENHSDILFECFKQKIENSIKYINSKTGNGYMHDALIFNFNALLKMGINNFFKNKNYLKSTNESHLSNYISRVLKNVTNGYISQFEVAEKVKLRNCPVCQPLKIKLTTKNGLLYCHNCNERIAQLSEQLKIEINKEFKLKLKSEILLHKIFEYHSKTGYKCNDCSSFIPKSYLIAVQSCPYPTCSWFGDINLLKPMAHPTLSFHKNNKFSGKNAWDDYISIVQSKQDATGSGKVSLDKNVSAISRIHISQTYNKQLKALTDTLIEQRASLLRTKTYSQSFKTLYMYDAFLSMLHKNEQDMIRYLVHEGLGNSPIQCKIIQEYIAVIEKNMPIEIIKKADPHTIYSLMADELGLFLGISEFESVVTDNMYLVNNTKEEYVGGRNFKNFGPCFIGYVIALKDAETDACYMNNMDNYTFNKIYMKDVKPGTNIKVTHFRIASHYDMGPLIPLQKVRKKVVDSIHLRLNGEKRQVKNKKNKTINKIYI